MSRKTVRSSGDLSKLLGRRVRVWFKKTRGEGRFAEGIVDNGYGGIWSFPCPEGGNCIVSNTRVMDVWNEKTQEWEPWT